MNLIIFANFNWEVLYSFGGKIITTMGMATLKIAYLKRKD